MIQRLEKVLQDAGGPYRAADWFRDQAADWVLCTGSLSSGHTKLQCQP